MIPENDITHWGTQVPWSDPAQVEQDLIICRALHGIYGDPFLADRLAFRGGTALHKLFLSPQPRYSEDIDLVQTRPEPIKDTLNRLRAALSFLGKPRSVAQKKHNNTLVYKIESEIPPTQPLRIKIEINCREHFAVLGFAKERFVVRSPWFSGACEILTYALDELVGTKLRALYQRKKGRDLFDLYRALQSGRIDSEKVVAVYRKYMEFSVAQPPSKKNFIANMEAKMKDADFLGDTRLLLRPESAFDPAAAYAFVKRELIEKLD